MSEDTSNQEVRLSSTGSVKLHIFHRNGKQGVAFQVWFNRLECGAIEFNYIQQTIMLANYGCCAPPLESNMTSASIAKRPAPVTSAGRSLLT